jgi:hypothetical protein
VDLGDQRLDALAKGDSSRDLTVASVMPYLSGAGALAYELTE